MSLISGLILASMDKKAEEKDSRRLNQNNDQVIKLADIKDFPFNFWMVCLICIAYYCAIFPFIALGK